MESLVLKLLVTDSGMTSGMDDNRMMNNRYDKAPARSWDFFSGNRWLIRPDIHYQPDWPGRHIPFAVLNSSLQYYCSAYFCSFINRDFLKG